MGSPVTILGISGLYHDSAAALLQGGKIVAAAQEERFTRKKHDFRMPVHAITYCLHEAKLIPNQLDYIVFYEKPLLKFDRLLETWFVFYPRGFRQFLTAVPHWLNEKLHIPREIDKSLNQSNKKKYIFIEHHESHAASAFFPSPYEEAAILTTDGVGEWATASVGIGCGNKIKLKHELRFPHSVGLLYSAFTYFIGFKVNSGEYKLMGLAPYGRPVYSDVILTHLLDLKEDGSFRLNMDYFTYWYNKVMVGDKFAELFDGPRREPESPLTQREMDIAASIQNVTEEIILRMVGFANAQTGMKNLVLAGGVALNCVDNGRILREGPFENIWIQPAAGDAGGALGAALFIYYQLLGHERYVDNCHDLQSGSFLGPQFTHEEIRSFLNSTGAVYTYFDDEDMLLETLAVNIVAGRVIGWLQGRMEFDPRALGLRSIIGDARDEQMQSRINLKIKLRESFRPFAPSVLHERATDYFELKPYEESPYMLLVAPIQKNKRIDCNGQEQNLHSIDLLKIKRSQIPGVTHVDYSARIQTVDPLRHGRYYRLLERFQQKTDCPLVINTSFNVRGEPIVCTPQDAYQCFLATKMDVLVLENFLLYKDSQPQIGQQVSQRYQTRFEMD
jgi:carbamoyltransferase